MRLFTAFPILFFLCTLNGAPSASQIVVPTDFATLDQAIAAAQPGDVILVQTSTLQAPVVIDKALTIIGDPIANIGHELPSNCNGPFVPIRLAGPGTGIVELVNCHLLRQQECGLGLTGLEGGGFSRLALYDCVILQGFGALSGGADGAHGLSTTVPSVFIAESTIIGMNPDVDTCIGRMPYPGRYAGVNAPQSTVVLLDSTVRGADGSLVLCCVNCSCPPSLAGRGGEGGDGVIAHHLFVANSTVAGGIGSTFHADNIPCARQPDGAPFVANLYVDTQNRLSVSGTASIGTSFGLAWTASGPITVLYYAFGPALTPTYFPGAGFGFGDPATTALLGIVPSGSQSIMIPVPMNPILVGLELIFQLADTSDGLSRAAAAVIVP